MTTKISLIIPVYNVEKYLAKCLDSIINQSLKDIEIICIDDKSTDNSLSILKNYAQKDPRFKIIEQNINQGQGVARNKGIEVSTGEYIEFVDPDDWIENGTLELLYNYAKSNNAQVVKFSYYKYNDYSRKIRKVNFKNRIKHQYGYDLDKNPYYTWKDLKNGCLYNLDLYVWSYFYSASFVKSNKIRFASGRVAEDHLFSVGALLLADKIYYLDNCLYYYRCRENSAVNKKSDENFCVFENINSLKDFLIKHGLYEELKDEFQKYVMSIITLHHGFVSTESIQRYELMAKSFFQNEKDFTNWIKKANKKRSLLENIFSIKNDNNNGVKNKVITILGLEFHFKPKKY